MNSLFSISEGRRNLADLTAAVRGLVDEAPGLISDRVHLLALELKRARHVLVMLCALGALAALFAACGWFLLCAALVGWIVSLGLGWPVATVIVAAVNLIAAAVAARQLVARVPLLAFPATFRRLTIADRHTALAPEEVPEGR